MRVPSGKSRDMTGLQGACECMSACSMRVQDSSACTIAVQQGRYDCMDARRVRVYNAVLACANTWARCLHATCMPLASCASKQDFFGSWLCQEPCFPLCMLQLELKDGLATSRQLWRAAFYRALLLILMQILVAASGQAWLAEDGSRYFFILRRFSNWL